MGSKRVCFIDHSYHSFVVTTQKLFCNFFTQGINQFGVLVIIFSLSALCVWKKSLECLWPLLIMNVICKCSAYLSTAKFVNILFRCLVISLFLVIYYCKTLNSCSCALCRCRVAIWICCFDSLAMYGVLHYYMKDDWPTLLHMHDFKGLNYNKILQEILLARIDFMPSIRYRLMLVKSSAKNRLALHRWRGSPAFEEDARLIPSSFPLRLRFFNTFWNWCNQQHNVISFPSN